MTVVAPSREPFESTLGSEVGALFRRAHEEQGVRFNLGSVVYRFEGASAVEAVTLEGGESIEADMVLVVVVVHPPTGFPEGVARHGCRLPDAGRHLLALAHRPRQRAHLVRVWRVSLVSIMAASAVLSPTGDVLNIKLFAAPMVVLYVVSIFVAWLCGRPRAARPEPI